MEKSKFLVLNSNKFSEKEALQIKKTLRKKWKFPPKINLN